MAARAADHRRGTHHDLPGLPPPAVSVCVGLCQHHGCHPARPGTELSSSQVKYFPLCSFAFHLTGCFGLEMLHAVAPPGRFGAGPCRSRLLFCLSRRLTASHCCRSAFRILEVARCSQLTDVGFTTLARVSDSAASYSLRYSAQKEPKKKEKKSLTTLIWTEALVMLCNPHDCSGV